MCIRDSVYTKSLSLVSTKFLSLVSTKFFGLVSTNIFGTLGQARDHGTGAANMAKATEQIMRRACTQFAEPPRRLHARPIFKRGRYEHLRGAITGITVDAAADEVLGAEMMRTPALTQEMHALAPTSCVTRRTPPGASQAAHTLQTRS